MSLHKATETIKKFGIGVGIGLIAIVLITIFIKIGGFVISIVVPPTITPPNHAYGVMPALQFPPNKVENNFTYVIDTASGALPNNFPDRLIVYPIETPEPNFLNLEKAIEKAKSLQFTDKQNNAVPEISLGDGKYEWVDTTGINRNLKIDTVSFNFSLTSNYLADLKVLAGQNLSNEIDAIDTAVNFLETIDLYPEDIDMTKIETPQKESNYDAYPKKFSIINGVLVPATSLATARVIRVDLHQKDVEYQLDTGIKKAKKIDMKLPIRYPNPPYSTMSFWIASGDNEAEVHAANFIYNKILTTQQATYPIKSAVAAFEELESGNAYIASYAGLNQQIFINNIYLAYYLGEEKQNYLMPIIVFEGQDKFFAYVSAIKDEWVE